jgi:hypothetical protein
MMLPESPADDAEDINLEGTGSTPLRGVFIIG